MNKYLAIFILSLLVWNCNPKVKNDNYITKKSAFDNIRVADTLIKKRNFDSAMVVLNNMNLDTVAYRDSVDAYGALSYAYIDMIKGDFTKSTKTLEHIRAYSIKEKLPKLRLSASVMIATILTHNMKLEKALKILQEDIDIAIETKSTNLHLMYNSMAKISYLLDNKSLKSLDYLNKGIEAFQDKESPFIYSFYHQKSTIFEANAMYDSALVNLEKAHNYYLNNNVVKSLPYTYATLGVIFGKLERYAESNYNLKKSYDLFKQIKKPAFEPLLNLASNYLLLNMYDSSRYFANKAIGDAELFKLQGRKEFPVRKVYKLLAQANDSLGNIHLAVKNYKTYIELNELHFEADLEKNISELEVKYETEKKEQEIADLNREMQFEKRQQLLIIVIFTILILSIVLVSLFVMKQRVLKEKQEQTLLEQRLLRSQMNPHFILNTFTAIQYFIANNQTNEAGNYLVKFSRLLRLSLDNSITPFVAIQDEVEALEHYLELQLMRFDRSFTYELKTYDDFEDDLLYIPPMLIQPFIENSIEHGFRGLSNGGALIVELKKDKDTIKCIVEDNGVGIAKANEAKQNGKKSLSMDITKKRLKLLGKKMNVDAGVYIVNKLDSGSDDGIKVVMNIPFNKSNDA